MKVLLDTHAVLWANLTPEKLSSRVVKLLSDPGVTVLVSAASALEISVKVGLGKLPDAEVFEREFLELPERAGYELLSLDVKTALRAGRLPGLQSDPFDRMIAAQALELDVPLVSIDKKMDEFGVKRVW